MGKNIIEVRLKQIRIQMQIQIQIHRLQSLQVQGLMFIVETSQSCFSFSGASTEQGQRPQTLPLPTIVSMI